MDLIDIDNKKIAFSNKEIDITIKYVLKTETEPIEKWLLISRFICYISDEKLLNNTIALFQGIPFLETTFANLNNLDEFIETEEIQNETDKTIIKATIYSLSFYCRILLEKFSQFIKNCDIPELRFNIVDRKIEHNLSEIIELIKRNSIGSRRDEALDLSTIKEQSSEVKKMIQSMEIIDYDNSTNYFDEEIKHLESIKKNLTQSYKPADSIKHENIFYNNVFIFENNFDNVSKTEVYEYFEKELVSKKYLTKEKLEKYLILAFQDKKVPEAKITFDKIKTQRETIRIFYNYYNIIAQKPYAQKRFYLELLTNYFIGYEYEKIETNFSK